jgi:hypothetical protein
MSLLDFWRWCSDPNSFAPSIQVGVLLPSEKSAQQNHPFEGGNSYLAREWDNGIDYQYFINATAFLNDQETP